MICQKMNLKNNTQGGHLGTPLSKMPMGWASCNLIKMLPTFEPNHRLKQESLYTTTFYSYINNIALIKLNMALSSPVLISNRPGLH